MTDYNRSNYNDARYLRRAEPHIYSSPAPGPSHLFDESQVMPHNSYQIWTPGLAPIAGSPSVPPARTITEQDVDEMYMERDPRVEEVDRHQQPSRPGQQAVQEPIVDPQPEGQQPIIPEVAQQHSRSRFGNFIGGFVAAMRHIPESMVKNNPRGSLPPQHPGLNGPTGIVFNSPRMSYYSSSPSIQSRISLQPNEMSTPYPQTTPMPIPEVPEPPEDDPHAATSTAPVSTPQDMVDDGTTAVHHGESPAPSLTKTPEQVQRDELDEYDMTKTPYPFTNPADQSLSSYRDRIYRLFTDIMTLPWMSSQITSDYIPELDSSRGRGRAPGPRVSWYTPRPKKEVDEEEAAPSPPSPSPLSTPPQPQFMVQTIPPTPTHSVLSTQYGQSTYAPSDMHNRLTLTPSQYTFRSYSRPASDRATVTRALRTPGTATSLGGLPSPGASSHGMGEHSVTYSYHYASPPTTQRGYPATYSAISTPQTRMGPDPDVYLSPSSRR